MYALRSICLILIVSSLYSCHSSEYTKAENALDAAREFIASCLQGDFKKAAFYMVDDKENQRKLLDAAQDYNLKSSEQKRQYLEASIIIDEDAALNDSVHIINYKNSYDSIARKLKVVNRNNTWLVDYKYTFNGNI